MVFTDPTRELYEMLASHMQDQGYRILTLNLQQPKFSNGWNPLAMTYSNRKIKNEVKLEFNLLQKGIYDHCCQYLVQGNATKLITYLKTIIANLVAGTKF